MVSDVHDRVVAMVITADAVSIESIEDNASKKSGKTRKQY